MSVVTPSSDADLLELLRTRGPLGVTEMAAAGAVTPTAIRQRLVRLMAQGLVERRAVRAGRGRPRHLYRLTQRGLRLTGSNFTDLALALWREVSRIEDPRLRNQMVSRVIKAMARGYLRHISGQTTTERMESIRQLLAERRLSFSVDGDPRLPVLTAHACPFPELAEEDREICDFEKLLYSELLGQSMELCHCRLDGEGPCQFRPS